MAILFKERGNIFFRLLDRYVGIPLILLLSIFGKRKTDNNDAGSLESVALIKMGAIGDSILTLPFIRKFNTSYKDINITVICGNNNHVVYKNVLERGYIDKIINVEFGRLIYDWPYLFRKIKEIGESNFDVCIDFDSWYRISALISLLVKAEYKIGFQKKGQYKHYLFDQFEVHRKKFHEFENYNRLTKSLIGNVQKFPDYPVSDEDSIFFKDFISANNIQKYVVLHPWASGYKNTLKELDTDSLVYIGNQLTSKGYNIILTGAKADAEKSESLSTLIEDSLSIAGKTTLNETAVFLKKAQCVITVNTGILHLAAAMDGRIVSINGPTDIARWGPLSENAINIKSTLFCSPCLDLGFEYKCKRHGVPEGHCMQKINLDSVVDAALKLAQSSKKDKSLQS